MEQKTDLQIAQELKEENSKLFRESGSADTSFKPQKTNSEESK